MSSNYHLPVCILWLIRGRYVEPFNILCTRRALAHEEPLLRPIKYMSLTFRARNMPRTKVKSIFVNNTCERLQAIASEESPGPAT